ncbi:MAG TPA: glycosyltransferase family 1 protein [Panacibacter sp.]|nr:glycosyltransferase family 1 protein [Panacibacter sp.]
MNIAFDAKRAYNNTTGLGHYSRTLIASLATYYPEHEYFLCTPKTSNRFNTSAFQNVHVVTPQQFPATAFKAAWRSSWVKKDLEQLNIDLYHGLSHEIPMGIEKTGIKSVVTIHDLIFERYPKQYNPIDVQIYRKKFRNACIHADKIIAISKQTKEDIIQFYKIPEKKIVVCYQACDTSFIAAVTETEKIQIKKKYNLPDQFFLYVGSVIERKNLLTICKAINALKDKLNIPLVIIGQGGKYKEQVKNFVAANGLNKKIIFLSEQYSFDSSVDFPAIYQQALCMIYPSIFEGFGIPVLEALWSKLPVITSNVSCLPEAGGEGALYVDPMNAEQIADAMLRIATENNLRNTLIIKGWQYAQNFKPQKCATDVMNVYKNLKG